MSLSSAIGGFLKSNIYVRIDRETLLVRDPVSGVVANEPAYIAISREPPRKVVALGRDAKAMLGRPDVNVVNPFSHPRSPLSDFTVAEVMVKMLVKKVVGAAWFHPAPTMVMHLAVPLEGDITQIEARALRELGIGAGGQRSVVWLGPDLTDEQVRNLDFPSTDEVVD